MESRLLIPHYLREPYRSRFLDEILQFRPIWENRYSESNPPPAGEPNRSLLRPVYWLGNWQFACLNYYHPPKGIENRCVQAEPYPPLIQKVVLDIERQIRDLIPSQDVPKGWTLNTCLINYYGSRLEGSRKVDAARVGEHKDFEPGPVASLSFGQRALFQFVHSSHKGAASQVALQQWLEDGSLQVFAGHRYKNVLFHRVQRVETKGGPELPEIQIPNFETRRLNLTFRFVPPEHIRPAAELPKAFQEDILCYVRELAQTSSFWRSELETLQRP
ncbi:MAG: alpha-ketoglutarate-dependent dioxygenase AlkB [Bdellovibrionales bacterium]